MDFLWLKVVSWIFTEKALFLLKSRVDNNQDELHCHWQFHLLLFERLIVGKIIFFYTVSSSLLRGINDITSMFKIYHQWLFVAEIMECYQCQFIVSDDPLLDYTIIQAMADQGIPNDHSCETTMANANMSACSNPAASCGTVQVQMEVSVETAQFGKILQFVLQSLLSIWAQAIVG